MMALTPEQKEAWEMEKRERAEREKRDQEEQEQIRQEKAEKIRALMEQEQTKQRNKIIFIGFILIIIIGLLYLVK